MAKKSNKPAKPKAAKKPVAKKPAAKKPAAKAKPAPPKKKPAPAKKPVSKKPVAKKPAPKKPEPKKSAAKKPAPSKAKPAAKAPAKPAPKKLPPIIIKKKPGKPVKLSGWVLKQRQRLLQLKDTLLDSMSGVGRDTLRSRAEGSEASAFGMHTGDAGSDAYDRDFALSLLSSDQDAIYEIEEALKRIEKNTYGVCELTNKPIPRARLDAIPWTRFTVEAQAQLEKEGALRSRNRLGSLGSVETGSGVEVDDDDIEIEEKPAKEKE